MKLDEKDEKQKGRKAMALRSFFALIMTGVHALNSGMLDLAPRQTL